MSRIITQLPIIAFGAEEINNTEAVDLFRDSYNELLQKNIIEHSKKNIELMSSTCRTGRDTHPDTTGDD